MVSRMKSHWTVVCVLLIVSCLLAGCSFGHLSYQQTSQLIEYLYPKDAQKDAPKEQIASADPKLSLPLKVGLIFVPATKKEMNTSGYWHSGRSAHELEPLTEKSKTGLMEDLSVKLRKDPVFKSVEIIPSTYVSPSGSFTNLDQVRTMTALDVIALLSYDQVQFSDEGIFTLLYWTWIGWYIVPGERNETNTMMDAAFYHIPSRKLLFRAVGKSEIRGRSTPLYLIRNLRQDSEEGFGEATQKLLVNLQEQVQLFKSSAK
jgi:rhombotail lipoprotein